MTDQTPALPALVTPSTTGQSFLDDATKRLREAGKVYRRMTEALRLSLGRMFYEAAGVLSEKDYARLLVVGCEEFDVDERTIRRYRLAYQDAQSLPPPNAKSARAQLGSIPRGIADTLSAPSIPSAGEGAGSAAAVAPPAEPPSGPTAAEPSPVTAADKADESGVEPEVPRSSGSAASTIAWDQLNTMRIEGTEPGAALADVSAAANDPANYTRLVPQDVEGAPVSAVPAAPAAQEVDGAGASSGDNEAAESAPASKSGIAVTVAAAPSTPSGRVAHGAAGEPQTIERVHETRGLTGLSLPVNPTDRQLDEVQEWFEGLLVRRSMEQVEHLRVACINAKLAQMQYRGNGSLKRDQVKPRPKVEKA